MLQLQRPDCSRPIAARARGSSSQRRIGAWARKRSATESSDEQEEPVEPKCVTEAGQKSIAEFSRLYEEKDLDLAPYYQRDYCWDKKKASRLVVTGGLSAT